MDEIIKFFVGLDAHKDSIAVAVCEAGREPSRFVGTLGPDVQGVLKTLRKYGPARQVSVGRATIMSRPPRQRLYVLDLT
jgi:hypothetical protein